MKVFISAFEKSLYPLTLNDFTLRRVAVLSVDVLRILVFFKAAVLNWIDYSNVIVSVLKERSQIVNAKIDHGTTSF